MKTLTLAPLLIAALLGCTPPQGRTTEMNPDCTQVSAEEQAKGNCMYRPEVPDEKSTRSNNSGGSIGMGSRTLNSRQSRPGRP